MSAPDQDTFYRVTLLVVVKEQDAVVRCGSAVMEREGIDFDEEVRCRAGDTGSGDPVAMALRWLIGAEDEVVPEENGFEIRNWTVEKEDQPAS